MRKTFILGIGQTKVDEHWDKSLRDLAGEAILSALQDADVNTFDALFVGNMMSASANRQQHIGAYLADWVGVRNIDAIRVESACSSGAAAFRSAVLAVSSGDIDSAMVVGVEKMSDSPISEITADLATAADSDCEASQGVSFVALNALIMQRYMHQYGWKHEDFAPFSINAHTNALNNPNARFHMSINRDNYLRAGMIAEPINLLDSSPTGDGAAAALIIALDTGQKISAKYISILASAASTDTIAVSTRKDPIWLRAAEVSSKAAYTQAGLSPTNIDVFEYHDAFTIMAALSLEASGFALPGQGPRLALDGEIALCGRIPVATMGGLKARGHPVGATGIYQIIEAVQQLRGIAGKNQVNDVQYAMTQNIGGSGSNIITHIFGKS